MVWNSGCWQTASSASAASRRIGWARRWQPCRAYARITFGGSLPRVSSCWIYQEFSPTPASSCTTKTGPESDTSTEHVRMKWNVGTKIGIGFGIALAIFVVVGAVSYRSFTQQTDATDWVVHTHEVQNEITLLLANLEEAESAARGYVITGTESYLAPYNSGIAAAEEHRKHVTHLTIDNPVQVRNTDALASLMADR